MNLRQVWAVTAGFFAVYIAITLTNRPSVAPRTSAGETSPIVAQPRQAPDTSAPALGLSLTRGVSLPTDFNLTDPSNDQTFQAIANSGAQWIAFTPVFDPAGSDPSATEAAAQAIARCKALGLHVLLRPEATPPQGLDASAAAAWLARYAQALDAWARLASAQNVDLFCIGTRLADVEQAAGWEELIRQVRGRFGGTITYDASAETYQQVPFWSHLDAVAIDGLTSAGGDWGVRADEIERWLNGLPGRHPVVLTDIADAQPIDDSAPFAHALHGRTWLSAAYWAYAGAAPTSTSAASP